MSDYFLSKISQKIMAQVKDWLIYYNNQRIQTKLGGKSPKEFRQFTALKNQAIQL
ncbi:IS3 family transposase [Weissella hellenica]|nr:IS3 family transposase [Weissella hellenica]